jgi:Leucine-rich repeat (LRR) protein
MLTELQELNISSNPLQRFPSVLTRLPNLEVLHLDQTGLEEIPANFQPAAIGHLSLARNQIATIPDKLFANGSSLRILRLQQNRLKVLPSSLACLIGLEELDLSYNELENLPEELGQLKRLEVVHLQGNRLRALPRSLGQLTALRQLTIHGNQLTTLPDSIGQLAALESLDASHNALRSLPGEIVGWQAMRWLVLSENQLTTLPAGFCRLSALTDCFLQRNRLSDLPANVSDERLPALRSLHLSNNDFPEDWRPPAAYRNARLL